MKSSLIVKLLLVVPLFSGTGRADHNDPINSGGRLVSEAMELERAVNQSYLGYQVKAAVQRFSFSVNRLADCVRNGARPIYNDHLEEPGVPAACRFALEAARQDFRPVSRFLWDAGYDYPEVNRHFRETEQVLNAIFISGPGPGPGPGPGSLMKCVATDSGWEEHFGGHAAFGRGVVEAQRAAMMMCQSVHGRCQIRSCSPGR